MEKKKEIIEPKVREKLCPNCKQANAQLMYTCGKDIVSFYAWECLECDYTEHYNCEEKMFVLISSVLNLIDKKLIMIPNYCDGETHIQYLERYKLWLKDQLNGDIRK